MKTKHIFIATFLVLATLVTVSSCKKYEEGPAFSLLTKKARLTGDWKLESVTIDGTDVSGLFPSDFQWSIKKDETYKISGTNISGSDNEGKWELGEDKDDVRFKPSSGKTETSYRITKLKSKALWMRNTASNGSVTYWKLKQ